LKSNINNRKSKIAPIRSRKNDLSKYPLETTTINEIVVNTEKRNTDSPKIPSTSSDMAKKVFGVGLIRTLQIEDDHLRKRFMKRSPF